MPPWTAVRDARDSGPWCPQLASDGTVIGDEDCLYLNVWVPPSGDLPRPVLVFLHGGGNVIGSSTEPVYDGAHLAERSGAVVVTLDYRLGPLGYLAHRTFGSASTGAGNYGLLDQKFALAWLQRNVGAFGGDPARVSVFGQSAGARNLCTLLASGAGDLFRAAVIQSGACEAIAEDEAFAFGDRFADTVGCQGAPDPAHCLRELSTDELVTALPDLPNVLTTSHYNPNTGVTSGLPPLAAAAASGASPISVIVGANAAEAGHIPQPVHTTAEYATLLRLTFGGVLADRVLELYPVSAFASPRDAWTAVVTDARYICPSQSTADVFSSGVATNVYRYLFAHALDHGPGRTWGAFHGLELLFVFGNFEATGYDPTDEERAFSDTLAGYWARLAETGDPNGPAAPEWPTYDAAAGRYLVLDTPIASDSALNARRCHFWQYEALPVLPSSCENSGSPVL